MLFTSTVFIFGFLPFILLGNFLLRKFVKVQNFFLLLSSLGFYAWGEPRFVFIMLASILVNWSMAQLLENTDSRKVRKAILGFALFGNIGILFVFKYLDFTIRIINKISEGNITGFNIVLPIGISFFTFQGLSYVIDVYRKDVIAENDIINVGMYISLFPQLIAGPIVRFTQIQKEIKQRITTWKDFSEGIQRFLMGFVKKVLLANNLAIVADKAFSINGQQDIGMVFGWMGAIAYSLQIFYDFSGYSEMAIGLGKMLGFHFEENFNYPYAANSITDFWRRWHISLSSWFRDYVYIPLGGNRKGKRRQIFNLVIVWSLTGIWHGANYTFILWGLFYGLLIIFEKISGYPQKIRSNIGRLGYRFITLFVVVLAWVMFRAENLYLAWSYIKGMFSFSSNRSVFNIAFLYLREFKWCFLAAIFFTVPWLDKYKIKEKKGYRTICLIVLYILFVISVSYLVKGSYNPFIYFNF